MHNDDVCYSLSGFPVTSFALCIATHIMSLLHAAYSLNYPLTVFLSLLATTGCLCRTPHSLSPFLTAERAFWMTTRVSREEAVERTIVWLRGVRASTKPHVRGNWVRRRKGGAGGLVSLASWE